MTRKFFTFKSLIITLATLTSTHSLACYFDNSRGREHIMSISLPKTITLPRDTALGTTIFQSAPFQHTDASHFRCDAPSAIGVISYLGSTSQGVTTFPIGDTGLSWQYIDESDGSFWPAAKCCSLKPGTLYVLTRQPSSMRIIKTGPIASGATIPAGSFGTLVAANLKLATFRSTGTTTFVPSSCQTPNINVTMGKHRIIDIPEDGSPSKNAISFNIKLNDCPDGISKISYTFTPTSSSPSQNDSQGIINLNQNSTAKGIGLQITDDNLSPIVLNQARPFNEYSNEGGNFTIPLNAHYVKILKGPGVIPGTANADITFTMSYQ